MRSARPVLVLCAGALMLSACGEREATPSTDAARAPATAPASSPAGTVLEVAQRDPDFTTLVSALQTAGMTATLNGPGPFTLFAPTNAAFEKVPAATRDALTTPAGQADLRRLLTYQVVPGRLDAAALTERIQLAGGSVRLTTLQGGILTAKTNPDGSIGLTDAAGGASRVVESDTGASNGVIHAIDTVVEPG